MHALCVARVEVHLPEVPGECVVSLLEWTRHEGLRSTCLTVFLLCLTVRACSGVVYDDIRDKQVIRCGCLRMTHPLPTQAAIMQATPVRDSHLTVGDETTPKDPSVRWEIRAFQAPANQLLRGNLRRTLKSGLRSRCAALASRGTN